MNNITEIKLKTTVNVVHIPIINDKRIYYIRQLNSDIFNLEYAGYQSKVKLEELNLDEVKFLEDYIKSILVKDE
jgi:hypothetical protein